MSNIESFLESAYTEFLKKSENAKTNAARQALREAAYLHALNQVLKEAASAIPPAKVKPPKAKTNQRTVNLVLSDLHFGANLKAEETGHKYDNKAESRSLAEVVRQVAEFKTDHRRESHLNIHIIGDIIQGELHDPRDGVTMTEQIADGSHLLYQAIRYLAAVYPSVTVFWESGNHGRRKKRHDQRATFEKWDSHETTIGLHLQYLCKTAGLTNVKFEIFKSPGYTWKSYGELGFATHGDTMVGIGNPGKSINVGNIEKGMTKISLAHSKRHGKPISMYLMGHLHLGVAMHPPFGALMVNGALIPPDNYANSIGILECRRGQYFWESTPGHILGDHRFVEIDEEIDANSSLDDIVSPYEGF